MSTLACRILFIARLHQSVCPAFLNWWAAELFQLYQSFLTCGSSADQVHQPRGHMVSFLEIIQSVFQPRLNQERNTRKLQTVFFLLRCVTKTLRPSAASPAPLSIKFAHSGWFGRQLGFLFFVRRPAGSKTPPPVQNLWFGASAHLLLVFFYVTRTSNQCSTTARPRCHLPASRWIQS